MTVHEPKSNHFYVSSPGVLTGSPLQPLYNNHTWNAERYRADVYIELQKKKWLDLTFAIPNYIRTIYTPKTSLRVLENIKYITKYVVILSWAYKVKSTTDQQNIYLNGTPACVVKCNSMRSRGSSFKPLYMKHLSNMEENGLKVASYL